MVHGAHGSVDHVHKHVVVQKGVPEVVVVNVEEEIVLAQVLLEDHVTVVKVRLYICNMTYIHLDMVE